MEVGTGFVMNLTQITRSLIHKRIFFNIKSASHIWCWEGVMHSYSNSLSTFAMICSLSGKLSFPPYFSE